MIETTHRAIHLVPYQRKSGKIKDTSEAPTVNVSKKYGTITFNKSCVRELGMDGQFIRLFYEPVKKIIAWKLEIKFTGDDNKGWKLVKARKSGTALFGIGSMMRDFNGGLKKDSYPGLEVKKNVIVAGTLEKGDTYYYVEIK